MKARVIQTKFYESERVLNLSASSRWLFMYYLTCMGIGLTGAFKWSISKTGFETGLSIKELEKAKSELSQSHLAFFYEDWIVIPGTDEKNHFSNGSKNSIAYKNEYDSLPEKVKGYLSGISEENTPIENVDTPIKGVSESTSISNSNSKEGGVGETNFRSLQSLTDEICTEISQHYRVLPKVVFGLREELTLFCQSRGKKYTDYKATLMNWVNRGIKEGKIHQQTQAVHYEEDM